MKKAKKGLLLSLFTLIAAVAITATSTYAWFIVNRDVTATNMQVTLRSDTTYLVISATNPGDGGVASLGTDTSASLGTDTSASATANAAAVLPVMYDTTGEDPTTPATRWKYASGTGYTNGAANGGYTTVAETIVRLPQILPIGVECLIISKLCQRIIRTTETTKRKSRPSRPTYIL